MFKSMIYLFLSTQGAQVRIVNLTSAKGQEINGRVTKISGAIKNGRYPLILRHISGDDEVVSLKAQNLNPFFKLSEEEELSKARRQAFVSYGHPIRGNKALVLEGHGRMFKQCITALKWNLMHIQPLPFFVNLSMDEFAEQYEGHPKARHLNQGIYDMYRVIPNQMEQTGEFQAGIQGFPMHLSLYSMLVWGLLKNERVYTEYEGAMVARCGLDGEGGSKIIHNFCRFANVWDTERIAGKLWIVRIARYGTLAVEHVDEDVFSEKEEALGNVYIIKGLASRVGETLYSMPKLCMLRLLPIYNVLVYDGFFNEISEVKPSVDFVGALKAKVDHALRKQTVIFCGKSSYDGLWDDEPSQPEMPEYDGPTTAHIH